MSLQEIKVNKILDTNGYIKRNHIHEDSILRFIPTKELENDYILMVDNKITTQHLTKHEIGKLLKNFKYTKH